MSQVNLQIIKGKTFKPVIRYETLPFIYKPISAIAQQAPARITAEGHNLTEGWRTAIVSVKGVTRINSKNTPPKDSDFYKVHFIDQDTIEINSLNLSEDRPYISGGYLQYYTPFDLSGATAEMKIRNASGDVIATLSSAGNSIILDNVAKTITLFLSATTTAAFTESSGVYDLELTKNTIVYEVCRGSVTILNEVTYG
jgi:hypothetical protein